MALIEIYADSRGFGTCRGCGAKMEWAETIAGKKMPFDREIVPVKSRREEATNRVVQQVDTTVSVPHWATCPESKSFKRK